MNTGQDFSAWFTVYPRTHRLRGQTVEVVPRKLLDEARAEHERVAEAARAVVEAHAALIRAVTPGDPGFLFTGPESHEQYEALFSRWHSTTRALRAALETKR